jgi:hypothetical protein
MCAGKKRTEWMHEDGNGCSLIPIHQHGVHGMEIAVPYQFHYVDLTMDLVRPEVKLIIIDWSARTAEDRTQTFAPAIQFPVGKRDTVKGLA